LEAVCVVYAKIFDATEAQFALLFRDAASKPAPQMVADNQ